MCIYACVCVCMCARVCMLYIQRDGLFVIYFHFNIFIYVYAGVYVTYTERSVVLGTKTEEKVTI